MDTVSVEHVARAAKQASFELALASLETRNGALHAMAQALKDNTAVIIAANSKDMAKAREENISESLLDRLMLDEKRVVAMADALEDLVSLEDPLGVVQKHRTLYNGIDLKRVSVPLGLVAMVYEARPNVTADAAGVCIKSGNACVLRGGSLALHSNTVLSHILHDAAVEAGLPANSILSLETNDRRATDELMSLHGIVDVLIPRGGAGLIKHCVEHSRVPVIETGTGNCHIYVEESADFDMAREIIINAKCRRMGVCNAAEGVLVDESVAQEFLPLIMSDLQKHDVVMHADEIAFAIAEDEGIEGVVAATEQDWGTEYLGPEISIKCVSDTIEAINHINQYGTKHSESIVTDHAGNADLFCAAVDAAAVYVNVSTAFTDGGEFGMGAEIGVSTQKLHARGPFALEAMTSYKYVLRGDGQVRS